MLDPQSPVMFPVRFTANAAAATTSTSSSEHIKTDNDSGNVDVVNLVRLLLALPLLI